MRGFWRAFLRSVWRRSVRVRLSRLTAFCVFLSGHMNKKSCCGQLSELNALLAFHKRKSEFWEQHEIATLFRCPLRNTQKAVRRLHLTRTPRRRTDRRACWKAFRKICAAVLVKYDRTDSANFVVKLIISQYRPKYKSLSALKLRCGVSMIRT